MHKHKYGNKDNELIWESLMNRATPRQRRELEDLLENDFKYVEEFLIAEGLMDTVKAGFGKAKDFAQQKLLKPIIDMLVKALAKDPQLASQTAAAAEQGPQALSQLASQKGQQPEIAESDEQTEIHKNQFYLNRMICDALVEEGYIDHARAKAIQGRYFGNLISEMAKEIDLEKPKGCPWMPAGVVLENVENAGPAQTAAADIRKIIDGTVKSKGIQRFKMFNAMLADDYLGMREWLSNRLGVDDGTLDQMVDQIKRHQQFDQDEVYDSRPEPDMFDDASGGVGVDGPSSDPENVQASPDTISDPNPPADVAPATDAPAEGDMPPQQASGIDNQPDPGEAPTNPAAATPPQGILSKIWGFMKNNKGVMTGAVALGVLGLMMTNPATAAIAVPALKAGLGGAIIGGVKGAATTQGGFKDRMKGAANAAGAGMGLGATMGGIGAGATELMSGSTGAEAATDAAPAAEPAPGPANGGMTDSGHSTADVTDADLESQYVDAELDGPDGALADGSISDEEAARINANLSGGESELSEPTRPEEMGQDAYNQATIDRYNADNAPVGNTTNAPADASTGGTPNAEYDTEADMARAHSRLDADGNGRLDDNEMPDLATFGNAMDGPDGGGGEELSEPTRPEAEPEPRQRASRGEDPRGVRAPREPAETPNWLKKLFGK